MALDLAQLLRRFDAENPCGLEVRLDPDFDDLVAAAKPAVEYERVNGGEVAKPRLRDWSRIRQGAIDLAHRGRDLRLEMLLLRSLVGTEGFSGLADGLRLVRLTLEQDWETLWPALETSEQDLADQALSRLNTLQQLNDPDLLLAELRRVPLASARGHEPATLRDLELAEQRITPLPDESVRDPALIDAVFRATPDDELRATAVAVEQGLAELTQIGAMLAEKLGDATQVPDFAPLRQVLERAAEALRPRLTSGSEPAPEATEEAADAPRASSEKAPGSGTVQRTRPASQTGNGVRGSVASRDDVLCALDSVLEYYQRHEPSSPVPLLIERARRVVGMTFLEAIEDLAPAAMDQLRALSGNQTDDG